MVVNRRKFLAGSSILFSASALAPRRRSGRTIPDKPEETPTQCGSANDRRHAGPIDNPRNDRQLGFVARSNAWDTPHSGRRWPYGRHLDPGYGRRIHRNEQAGFAKGLRALHFIGGNTIEIRGNREVRADQDDHLSSAPRFTTSFATSYARAAFMIILRNAQGVGALSSAQSIYEKDRMAPRGLRAQSPPRS